MLRSRTYPLSGCQNRKLVPPRKEVGSKGRSDMPSGYYDATGDGLPNDFGR